jgi:hypothetical protein
VGVGRVGAAGVWHRPYVARGAWYRGGYGAAAVGAAAVGGAALGAAAASTYPYYGATCGYYPYPPCYCGASNGIGSIRRPFADVHRMAAHGTSAKCRSEHRAVVGVPILHRQPLRWQLASGTFG